MICPENSLKFHRITSKAQGRLGDWGAHSVWGVHMQEMVHSELNMRRSHRMPPPEQGLYAPKSPFCLEELLVCPSAPCFHLPFPVLIQWAGNEKPAATPSTTDIVKQGPQDCRHLEELCCTHMDTPSHPWTDFLFKDHAFIGSLDRWILMSIRTAALQLWVKPQDLLSQDHSPLRRSASGKETPPR